MMKHSMTMRTMAGALIFTMLCTGVFARPPGRMIDIGGRNLHVVETAGAEPVVMLEAGGGGFSSFWLKVQPLIRDELGLRVISYDRAGLGWSEPGPLTYRIHDKADDLDALLTALDVDVPIVLVAHSYGGWVAQAFASRYPERIAALVLVDPNSSYFFSQYLEKVAKIEVDGGKRPIRGLRRLGLKLLRNWLAKHSDEPRSYFEPILTDRHQAALGHALSVFGTTSSKLSQARLPDVPTIMISRGRPQKGFPWGSTTAEAAWRDGHKTMIEHLSNKEHWIAKDAAHAVVIDQPGIIVEAIAAVIRDGFTDEEDAPSHTFWHDVYDIEARSVSVSFSLSDNLAGGDRTSEYNSIQLMHQDHRLCFPAGSSRLTCRLESICGRLGTRICALPCQHTVMSALGRFRSFDLTYTEPQLATRNRRSCYRSTNFNRVRG